MFSVLANTGVLKVIAPSNMSISMRASYVLMLIAPLLMFRVVIALPTFVCGQPVDTDARAHVVAHHVRHWHPECSWGGTTTYEHMPSGASVRKYFTCERVNSCMCI